MTREEIMNLDAEGIEKRNAEIKIEIETATEQAQLDALVEERKILDERKEALIVETRKADMLYSVVQNDVYSMLRAEQDEFVCRVPLCPEWQLIHHPLFSLVP